MLVSLTAKLLHAVMLKRPLNLCMAENNSESVDVDPPLQHRHTWNGYLLTGSCCSRGRVSFYCWTWILECLFSGYAFGYGPKTTGATNCQWLRLVRLLAAGQTNLRNKTAKNNTYKSKIIIPTLYKARNVNISLHCKFRSGVWRHHAAFQDSLMTFENAIIDIDTRIAKFTHHLPDIL